VGNPVLVVPMGFTEAGLPLSMQIAGPAFGEAGVLAVGDAFQQRTDWHLRVPTLVDDVSAAA
jgi:aspartyl-tRNA(Asn)/glutamyl-tRNA(Gln) amidotransferase subunit A